MKSFCKNFASFAALTALAFTGCNDPLRMDMASYTEGKISYNGNEVYYRAYEDVVYVSNPVDTEYQTMNIYVPEAYFNGGSVNGYNAKTAPIFLPNTVGGYMPGKAGTLAPGMGGSQSASVVALANGMVVAAPGARGRTTQNEEGVYTGKAPACIVDLKAAVRYLRHNKKRLPGNTEKIVSNGTSAGGALSALLASSGNSKDYEPYLEALGAAKERDNIFAASVYCPITNLENANAAYEWQFEGHNDYQKMDISMLDYHVERKLIKGSLTKDEEKLSHNLATSFPFYLKSLELKNPATGVMLKTDKERGGSFDVLLMDYIEKSLEKKLKSLEEEGTEEALNEKTEILSRPYITTDEYGKVSVDRFDFIEFIGRQKLPGAFDSLAADTGENSLFGDENTDTKHFTNYAFENDVAGAGMADEKIVKIMNAMNYLGNADTAKYWRIRHGTSDRDTSFAIPLLLALSAEQNAGAQVDFAMPWDVTHSGDYDLEELFAWINSVCR